MKGQSPQLRFHRKETGERKAVRGDVRLDSAQKQGEMSSIVSLAQRAKGAFSMGTMEGACLTGGPLSIWGPPNQNEHDGAQWLVAGAQCPWWEGGGASQGLPGGPDEPAAEAGMGKEKHDLSLGVYSQHKPCRAKADGT